MRIALACVVTAAAGCYSPSVPDCAYACSAAGTCPSGLRCDDQQMCRVPEMIGTACGAPPIDSPVQIDAALDAYQPDAAPVCAWANLQRNFTTADVTPASTIEWGVHTNTIYMVGGSTPAGMDLGIDAESPYLIHVRDLSVDPGVTLTIVGAQPVIIAADSSIGVHGTIYMLNGEHVARASCTAKAGASVCSTAGGGGGGGNGAPGAPGGGAIAGTTGTGGSELTLDPPLEGGCVGGAGGNGPALKSGGGILPGGPGGYGGGALQLSAQLRVIVDGTIESEGRGGGKGTSDAFGAGNCNMAHGNASGGGGGGAGGLIVLDSCDTEVLATASLCASGGGGGGGGGGGNSSTITDGKAGNCIGSAAGGVGESNNSGGVGGFAATMPGPGAIATYAGGGGGGGIGNIRIHQIEAAGAPMVSGAAHIVPAASVIK